MFLIDDRMHQNEGRSPDAFWLENLWEFKNPSSYNAVDMRVRKGLKQIKDNPGGVVLSFDESLSVDKCIEIITKRATLLESGRDYVVDIIIIQNERIVRILRYE